MLINCVELAQVKKQDKWEDHLSMNSSSLRFLEKAATNTDIGRYHVLQQLKICFFDVIELVQM